VLLLPPPPEKVLTDAGYLWLSDNEYQQCYEEQDYESMYPIGAYIDFSEAIQNAFDQRECLGLNENDDYWLYGLPIRGEVDTHKDCECPYCDERIWLSSGLTDQAITLREFLLSEPDEFARSLTSSDRYYIREWSGVLRTPSQDEVLAAVLTDPMHGLGGAALDYAIWNKPEDYGTAGEHMYELIEEVEGENGLTRIPVQSFLFRKDDLHQSTEPVMFEAIPELWRLYGGYAVDKIEYTSDLTGKVAVGWRSCWVRPHGIAVMPEFDDR
jgi:hypothetical protein